MRGVKNSIVHCFRTLLAMHSGSTEGGIVHELNRIWLLAWDKSNNILRRYKKIPGDFTGRESRRGIGDIRQELVYFSTGVSSVVLQEPTSVVKPTVAPSLDKIKL